MASIDHLRSGQPLTTNRGSQNKTQDSSQTSSGREAQSASATPRDAVSLSQQSRAIDEMNQQLAAEPHFDSAKVAAIKDAIANGSYKIDADRLAVNIMRFEDDLKDVN